MKKTMQILFIALASSQVLAAQGACKPILDAEMKAYELPLHMYIKSNVDSTAITVEAIYVGGHGYMLLSGKWKAAGDTKDVTNLMQKKRQQHSNATCSYVKDDSVNGEAAALYSMTAALSGGGKLDSQVWISKSKGVPLRQEDVIDSRGHQTHNSTRYEYNNVKAPM